MCLLGLGIAKKNGIAIYCDILPLYCNILQYIVVIQYGNKNMQKHYMRSTLINSTI